MMRKSGVVLFGLCMVLAFALRVNAQEGGTASGNSQPLESITLEAPIIHAC